MRGKIALAMLLLVGCASDKSRIVDGGVVDHEGWPVRDADGEYRCPEGTDLLDDMAPTGRRTVTCKTTVNPLPRGFQLTWSESGSLISELSFSDEGVPQERKQWFEDGKPAVEEVYHQGQLVHRMNWYENGEQMAEVAYDEDRGIMRVRRFQPDGSLEAEGQLRDGKKVGEWREWRDGALEVVEYVGGVPDGKVLRKYPSGGQERGQYEAGRKVGTWTRVDQAGMPVREINYSSDSAEGVSRTFHPNSQLREEGLYSGGEKHGRWRTWHPSGELATDRYYSCGTEVGPVKTYFPSGELKTSGVYDNGRKAGEWKVFNKAGVATKIDGYAAPQRPFDEENLPEACEESTERAPGKDPAPREAPAPTEEPAPQKEPAENDNPPEDSI